MPRTSRSTHNYTPSWFPVNQAHLSAALVSLPAPCCQGRGSSHPRPALGDLGDTAAMGSCGRQRVLAPSRQPRVLALGCSSHMVTHTGGISSGFSLLHLSFWRIHFSFPAPAPPPGLGLCGPCAPLSQGNIFCCLWLPARAQRVRIRDDVFSIHSFLG